MKRTLATITAILMMLSVSAFALDFPKPELDHGAAVKRIENAKIHYIEKGEPSEEDAPVVKVIVDYLDLYNTQTASFNQRLIIIRY